jgi:hypothetical protein
MNRDHWNGIYRGRISFVGLADWNDSVASWGLYNQDGELSQIHKKNRQPMTKSERQTNLRRCAMKAPCWGVSASLAQDQETMFSGSLRAPHCRGTKVGP